ncbi:histone H3.Y [Plecturocebus cupreus]
MAPIKQNTHKATAWETPRKPLTAKAAGKKVLPTGVNKKLHLTPWCYAKSERTRSPHSCSCTSCPSSTCCVCNPQAISLALSFQSMATGTLQGPSEAYLMHLFEDTILCATHARLPQLCPETCSWPAASVERELKSTPS